MAKLNFHGSLQKGGDSSSGNNGGFIEQTRQFWERNQNLQLTPELSPELSPLWVICPRNMGQFHSQRWKVEPAENMDFINKLWITQMEISSASCDKHEAYAALIWSNEACRFWTFNHQLHADHVWRDEGCFNLCPVSASNAFVCCIVS